MSKKDFTTTFSVDQTPQEVFKAINNVSAWWSEDFKGSSKKLNDEFEVLFFGDVHYSKQKLVEVVPNKKVVWLITESRLNFIEMKDEWNETKICFEISEEKGKTKLHFTHFGLVPEVECFNDCFDGWNYYLKQSLKLLITTGTGKPTQVNERMEK